jgi:hypothetical protein
MKCEHESDSIVNHCNKGHQFCQEDKCPDYKPVDNELEA